MRNAALDGHEDLKIAIIILNGIGVQVYDENCSILGKPTKNYSLLSDAMADVEEYSHVIGVSQVCGERGQSWVSRNRVPTHAIIHPGGRDYAQHKQAISRTTFNRRHLLGDNCVYVLCTQNDYDNRIDGALGMDSKRKRHTYKATSLDYIMTKRQKSTSLGLPCEFEENQVSKYCAEGEKSEYFFYERLFKQVGHSNCLHAMVLSWILNQFGFKEEYCLQDIQRMLQSKTDVTTNLSVIPNEHFSQFSFSNANRQNSIYDCMVSHTLQYWQVDRKKKMLYLNAACISLLKKMLKYNTKQNLISKLESYLK